MDETKANAMAKLLGGEAYNSGGGIWLVTLTTYASDFTPRFTVFSDECICEYFNEDDFQEGNEPLHCIMLTK